MAFHLTKIPIHHEINLHQIEHLLDLKFLKECKRNEVQPNFTKVKLANNNINNKAASMIRDKILDTEIQFKILNLNKISQKLKNSDLELKNNLSTFDLILFKRKNMDLLNNKKLEKN
jgi:hypothetical protein